jgi:hypothetical protein
MFGFFRNREPVDPPTDKQRKYAARLGVSVIKDMSKSEVSLAIAEAERKNPKAAVQRERAKAKARESKYGQELIDQESYWNQFADDPEYMLAVYKRGNQTVVDVLRVNVAFIAENGSLKLGVAAPKLVKDRHIGEHLDWDHDFELHFDALLHHEPLRKDWYDHDSKGFTRANREYKMLVEKGLTVARKL